MIIWKWLANFLLFSGLGGLGCGPAKVPLNSTDLLEMPFEHDLQEAIDQVLLDYPEFDLGISAAIVTPGYRPWVGVSGFSHPGVPLTPEMVFDVGSVAKNFEAALILKFVENDRLSLDDPISKFLPAYPHVHSEITLRQLLDHSSGIFNVFEHPDFPWVGANVDYSKVWQPEEVFREFVLEPYGPPGSVQHYSSTNYLLVTKIIEEVTATSLTDEINRSFLNPLQLENTYVSMGDPPPAEFSVAHPWADVDQDGDLDDLHGIPLTWKVTLTHPVIFSNPEDLAHWMHALYEQGKVISPSSMDEMLTYPETATLHSDGSRYGLGVVDYSEILGVKAIGHGGSSLGYSAAALYLPEYKVSIVWLINTGESPSELAHQMMGATWTALSEVLINNLEPKQ